MCVEVALLHPYCIWILAFLSTWAIHTKIRVHMHPGKPGKSVYSVSVIENIENKSNDLEKLQMSQKTSKHRYLKGFAYI